jgi:RimJ/RimL family protein N-acetyltransferase
MFASERVRLRPMVPDDATVLYEMWSDPEHHLITSESPMLVESLAARRTRLEKSQAEPDVSAARFTAETIADGTVIGTCNLWGLDAFNQFGHLGIPPLAESCGFVLEGTQRERAYDGDGFSDIVLYGLLRQERSR